MRRRLLREINYISRTIMTQRERELSKFNLKKGQHSFLTRIVENPGINQKELSSSLGVNKGTTAKAIKKLIESEYIIKVKCKDNLKTCNIYATKLGEKVYVNILEVINNSTDNLFKDVEVEALYKMLLKVKNNID